MHVEPSQLVPGCILLKEVKGKTNRPLIPENTILEEKHIMILKKFLVESVHVSSKLDNGKSFTPKEKEETHHFQIYEKEEGSYLLFKDHYRLVVTKYKQLFEKWQSGMPVDMPSVRKLFIPLLERIADNRSVVFTLHQYGTKDDYFYYHSVGVGVLSAFLGKKMGLEKGEWLQIGLAGLLSDCGMARIDPDIIKKSSSLTLYELKEIQNHPTYSYRMIEHLRTITRPVKLAVLQHHERMNGSGYPLGLSQNKIHLYARIIAVCDMYHAMTSERLYKEKQSPFKAMEEIKKDQFSKLDPQIVNLLIKGLSNVSIGKKVKLSDDRTGKIVFIDAKKPTRPMIQMENSGDVVALQDMPEIVIDDILPD